MTAAADAADPEVLAVVAAAYALLSTPATAPLRPPDDHLAWRFSGRWWTRPAAARRDRPFTGG